MTDEIDPNILLSCKMKKRFEKIIGTVGLMIAWVVGLGSYFAMVAGTAILMVAMMTLRLLGTYTPPRDLTGIALMYTIMFIMAAFLCFILRGDASRAVRTACYGSIAGTITIGFPYIIIGVSAGFYYSLMASHPIIAMILTVVSLLFASVVVDDAILGLVVMVHADPYMGGSSETAMYFREMEKILDNVLTSIGRAIAHFFEKCGFIIGIALYAAYIVFSAGVIIYMAGAPINGDFFLAAAFSIVIDAFVVMMGLGVLHDEWRLDEIAIGASMVIIGLVSAVAKTVMIMIFPGFDTIQIIGLGLVAVIMVAYPAITAVCWTQIDLIRRKKSHG
jgi:hypothetical protein